MHVGLEAIMIPSYRNARHLKGLWFYSSRLAQANPSISVRWIRGAESRALSSDSQQLQYDIVLLETAVVILKTTTLRNWNSGWLSLQQSDRCDYDRTRGMMHDKCKTHCKLMMKTYNRYTSHVVTMSIDHCGASICDGVPCCPWKSRKAGDKSVM